ncbi:MAG: type II secretion system protein GspG [Myxococcota bacterium]|nr:type II secretion system protein GspG [Myxococcota bacterium]
MKQLWTFLGLGAALGVGAAALVDEDAALVRGEQHAIATELQISAIEQALEDFHAQHGRYPQTLDGLRPYFDSGAVPKDYWRRPFRYRMPGEHGPYDLWSYGRDGEPGGVGEDADIEAWSMERRYLARY